MPDIIQELLEELDNEKRLRKLDQTRRRYLEDRVNEAITALYSGSRDAALRILESCVD